MTLNCVGLTQSSVVQIIHRNVGLKCFIYLRKFLLLSLVFAYIYISQGSVCFLYMLSHCIFRKTIVVCVML